MKTKNWAVGKELLPDRLSIIQEAAEFLRAGKLVAFPTETVYGLGADARSTEAVEGIFRAKGRPSDNPLIVHIADKSQLHDLVDRVDETSCRLMDACWPGPLTLVLPVKPGAVSPRVTAGLATVAVRMPEHPLALALLRAAGCPVAAPSANRSGRPSPTEAQHVRDDLDGLIDGIVDGGPTGVGVESTVVEVDADGRVHVLRPGGVSAERLAQLVPEAQIVAAAHDDGADGYGAVAAGGAAGPDAPAGGRDGGAQPLTATAPKSPGMKYAHYAPRGRLTLVRGDSAERVAAYIRQELDAARSRGEVTGVLTVAERASLYTADLVVPCGSLAEPESVARGLYAALRRFDDAGATFILAETPEERGIGAAVLNRLRKAAADRVVEV
ncbi:L-threonylcarbamoyladenylate synthase [Paenibacillus sp. MBLB4367]|uniref:L-threonylcarbamoyladenylate synthase n=1 Tax=Paenibacillus sp. MBLB4367 TaxID=3384767 RepID=UPI003908075E